SSVSAYFGDPPMIRTRQGTHAKPNPEHVPFGGVGGETSGGVNSSSNHVVINLSMEADRQERTSDSSSNTNTGWLPSLIGNDKKGKERDVDTVRSGQVKYITYLFIHLFIN